MTGTLAPIPPRRVVIAAGALLLAMILTLFVAASLPVGDGKRVEMVTVPEGAPARTIASLLKRHALIRSEELFLLRVRLKGAGGKIRAGVYRLDDALSPSHILDKLMRGEVYVVRFAVPEGYSIAQLAEMLEGKRLCGKGEFLQACRDQEIRQEFGIAGETVEGYLAPLTYDITPGTPPLKIIRPMITRFMEGIEPMRELIRRSPFSLHQIVTLASMVEKEAVKPQERALIAAVFLNRLKRGMRLQSDPTAIYGKKSFGGEVTAADVRTPSPYNTYLIDGLPPGPIGNPSIGAIRAVLEPADVPYLYFVAKKDGTHHFSRTLAEHNQAIATWLK
ncbi:MAG: endolytic transglycosylase MltG [Desulfuromonadia bacterium]